MDKAERSRDENAWFGAKAMYDRAGFVEVAPREADAPRRAQAAAREAIVIAPVSFAPRFASRRGSA